MFCGVQMKIRILDDITEHLFFNTRGNKFNFDGEYECNSIVHLCRYLQDNYAITEPDIRYLKIITAARAGFSFNAF